MNITREDKLRLNLKPSTHEIKLYNLGRLKILYQKADDYWAEATSGAVQRHLFSIMQVTQDDIVGVKLIISKHTFFFATV